MPTGYVYLITNLLDSKWYVGQTTKTPEQRWHDHVLWSRTQRVYLSHAIKKYGPNNFALSPLAVVERASGDELKAAWTSWRNFGSSACAPVNLDLATT